MSISADARQKQVEEAEALLFSGPQKVGFAKALYFGEFLSDKVLPYPQPDPDEAEAIDKTVAEVRTFVENELDAVAIDRNADIPRSVIDGLGRVGVLGMAVPQEYGGRGMSQTAYCRVMEVIGGHCASTGVFVNAHHSIGACALVLFGTPQQKERWLPALARGEKLAAFALTEPEAGSDAANVQTLAVPSADGSHYVMNGEKRYITNGSIAEVLTVMAKTPKADGEGTEVSAFLVTPDLPGFEVTEARMEKCGIRGTVTSRLAFHDMHVPADRLLGELGRGLKIALTVLDFGRTTFGASCTGAAKVCLRAAAAHAKRRKQFGQPLADFELVKQKLARMAADIFAMQSATYHTAAVIDRDEDDYMLETAMLKVWASESLWRIVNDTIQIFGGRAYFTDEPYERMMRDARINLIGEGANDVLAAFIALVGMREVGVSLQGVLKALKHPIGKAGLLTRFAGKQLRRWCTTPRIPIRSDELKNEADDLARMVRDFGRAVEGLLRRYRESIVDRQYLQERVAGAAMELYFSSCVLSRLDGVLTRGDHEPEGRSRDLAAGLFSLRTSRRTFRRHLARLWDNDDEAATRAADAVLQ